MKKIGISTVHTGYNYGSSLQAYATKMILKELGYTGTNIALKGSLVKGRDVRVKKLAVIALRLLQQPHNIKKRVGIYGDNLNKNYSEHTKRSFDDFRENKIEPSHYTWRQLKKIAQSDEYKAFLCGSDQIWNAEALYVDPQYYLRFSPKNKRIAFAPSFGRDKVAKYNKKVISKYIKDIPHLSVREESGVNIVNQLANVDASHLIDPTLILDSNRWDEYLNLKNNTFDNEEYILAYFLNEPSDYAKEYMLEIAKQNNLKIIALPYQRGEAGWFDTAPSAGPIEFVQLVKNAVYICTDSFHGTAFAINYSVPFYTFERQYGFAGKQSARVVSLLKLVSLENLFNPSFEILGDPIDFGKSKIVLEVERKKSLKYLKNAIE